MVNLFRHYGFWLIAGILAFSIAAAGQDLGSSNGLFRAPNPKTKSRPPASKRNAARPKSATAKSSAKLTKEPKPKVQTAKTDVEKVEPAEKPKIFIGQPPREDVIIKIGQAEISAAAESLEKEIEKGNKARDARNYSVAEAAYYRAQKLQPKDSRSIYGLGNIFSDQQRWEEAEKAYRTAIRLEPESPEAHIALSFVLTQPVSGANPTEKYAEAEKMARKAIELDANNAAAYDQLGVALELSGTIADETQNAYRKAIALDPAFALAYAHLGRLLRRKGLEEKSSTAYGDAIRMAIDVPTMILVADVMQSQQRYSESEQLLRRALRGDAKNPTALFLLGRALTTRGAFAEAEKLLKTSVEVSPKSFVSYALLGSLYARQDKFIEAEKTLTRALRVVSLNEKKRLSQEFEIVGDGFAKTGKNKDAARVYRQALELDGENSLLAGKLSKIQN